MHKLSHAQRHFLLKRAGIGRTVVNTLFGKSKPGSPNSLFGKSKPPVTAYGTYTPTRGNIEDARALTGGPSFKNMGVDHKAIDLANWGEQIGGTKNLPPRAREHLRNYVKPGPENPAALDYLVGKHIDKQY